METAARREGLPVAILPYSARFLFETLTLSPLAPSPFDPLRLGEWSRFRPARPCGVSLSPVCAPSASCEWAPAARPQHLEFWFVVVVSGLLSALRCAGPLPAWACLSPG